MAEYKIHIKNQQKDMVRFVLYQDSPFKDAKESYGAIWMVAHVNSGGTKTLKIKSEFFACMCF
jgi:hypothetical protein